MLLNEEYKAYNYTDIRRIKLYETKTKMAALLILSNILLLNPYAEGNLFASIIYIYKKDVLFNN